MPRNTENDAREVVRRLRAAGHEAYFAGGCVRDRLMGATPEDYDVATDASPDRVMQVFRRTIPVGKAFGVILVRTGDSQIEVATFRADGRYLDGRRPESVTFADLRSDVMRRDFTVNGMMYDPEADRVIDLVGGREDLAQRRVRAIGDPRARFGEDHLRLVRAIRFACKLDFEIEAETLAAVRELAPRVASVSGERVRNELERILATARAERGVRLLRETGLLDVLLPEVARSAWFDLAAATLGAVAPCPLPAGLAALLGDAGGAAAEKACERLRLSRQERDAVLWLVTRRNDLDPLPDGPVAAFKRLARAPLFPTLLELYRARCLAAGTGLDRHARIAAQVAAWSREDLAPKPFLDGNDLLALGLPPGREVGAILADLEDAQLEGRIRSREEALARARERMQQARR